MVVYLSWSFSPYRKSNVVAMFQIVVSISCRVGKKSHNDDPIWNRLVNCKMYSDGTLSKKGKNDIVLKRPTLWCFAYPEKRFTRLTYVTTGLHVVLFLQRIVFKWLTNSEKAFICQQNFEPFVASLQPFCMQKSFVFFPIPTWFQVFTFCNILKAFHNCTANIIKASLSIFCRIRKRKYSLYVQTSHFPLILFILSQRPGKRSVYVFKSNCLKNVDPVTF